jgi:cytidylate kinase
MRQAPFIHPQIFSVNRIIIAIDGYSSCGKSTLAKAVAQELGYIYIDSGAMYRAVTLFLQQHHIPPSERQAVVNALPEIHIGFENHPSGPRTLLNGRDVEHQIRGMAVAEMVSSVAAIPEVRRQLVRQQQLLGAQRGIAMDGRDIGTVVFPSAALKIFLTAGLEVRVNRRWLQLQRAGQSLAPEEIRRNLLERDYIDSTRSDSPLLKAPDCIVMDNSNLTEQEQLLVTLTLARARIAAGE